MRTIRDALNVLLEISKIVGSSPSFNSANHLRVLYLVADTIKNGFDSKLSYIGTKLKDLSSKIPVSVNTNPQTIDDVISDLDSINSELAALLSAAFAQLNSIGQITESSYNTGSSLAELVTDLSDLASKSQKLTSFLESIIIPYEFVSAFLSSTTYSNDALYVNVGPVLPDGTYCGTTKFTSYSCPSVTNPLSAVPTSCFIGYCGCISGYLTTAWKFQKVNDKIVFGPMIQYVFSSAGGSCASQISSVKWYSYSNGLSVRFTLSMGHSGRTYQNDILPNTYNIVINASTSSVASYDPAKVIIQISENWTPAGYTALQAINKLAGNG